MGFADGSTDLYPTQLPADGYAAAAHTTEAIDIINFHSVGIIATADADPGITGNVNVAIQCNDTYLTADGGWITVGAIFQRNNGLTAGTLVARATDQFTWTAASTDADNVIFDCIMTEDLPVSGNGLPSRYMRIVATNAGDGDVFSVVMFCADADYLGGGGDWGDVPAEQL